jgi:hypothetical protein
MKKLIIVFLMLPFALSAQKVISPATRVDTLFYMPTGLYRFITTLDTVDLSTAGPLYDTIKITVHDTIPRVCPTCPICKVYTAADTAAIQALKVCPTCPTCPVCPPPVICPVCPPPPKQRTANSLTWNPALGKWVIGYDDGSTPTTL